MEPNVVFNATVCLIGVLIQLVHIVNLLIKKGRRKDETALLVFLAFTAFHFSLYFLYTLIKVNYPSDALNIGAYTTFYIANNLEAFLLYIYMNSYVDVPKKIKKPLLVASVALLLVFVALDFVNIFSHMFFTSVDGVYTRSPLMILSQIYQFILFAAVFAVAIFNKGLKPREKWAFALYCLLPLVAIVLQNIFKGFAIAYLSIIVAVEVLFFFLNVGRNMELAEEKEKTKDARIRVMLSQIQPHFIYNSLSSISTLILLEPKKAQNALDHFTEYLRANLSSLTATGLIYFDDELRHIETFLSLEKVRFDDRLKIVYDISTREFYVPPLSIEPLVENAVKHGILKKVEGGTLILRTYEEEDANVVEVIDDGVGFETSSSDPSSNAHVGLKNVSYRLAAMGNGVISVDSKVGVGTKVTVRFKK